MAEHDELLENLHSTEDQVACSGFRVQDLIAKTARVTLKDTVRVLKALDLVADFLGLEADVILGVLLKIDKPTPEEAIKCADAFNVMLSVLADAGERERVDLIRAMD